MPDRSHAESEIRFCKQHNVYYDSHEPQHGDCETWSLQWGEVIFYLNRRRETQEVFLKLRELMSF